MNQVIRPLAHPLRHQPNFSIRPARRDQMGMIADFVRSSADWYRDIVDEKDMEEHEVGDDWMDKNFQRRYFYIGYAGEEPVGTISMQYFDRFAYLGYIYLDVAHVGKGYGRKLMDFAEMIARARRMDGMALIAHPEAVWAQKAYLKYGFSIEARDKEEVISWQDGALETYYEEGFELYLYHFDDCATLAQAA